MLFSDLAQFKLTSEGTLKNSTVSVDVTTQFEADLGTKPIASGRYVYFAFKRGAWAGLREYFVDGSGAIADASDVTGHVPNYIEGSIRGLTSSTNENVLMVLSENERDTIYVYNHFWQGNERIQSAWSKWIFDGEVLGVEILNSEAYIIINRPDGTFLEKINLSKDDSESLMNIPTSVHLDRRVLLSGSGSTIPYTDNVQYITMAGRLVTDPEPYLLIGESVYAGVTFRKRYIFSEQVIKDQNGQAMATARAQMRRLLLNYNKTGAFTLLIRPSYRDEKTLPFSPRVLGEGINILNEAVLDDGVFKAYILSQTSEVEIEIQSDSWLPCTFQSAEWEGYIVSRSQRT